MPWRSRDRHHRRAAPVARGGPRRPGWRPIGRAQPWVAVDVSLRAATRTLDTTATTTPDDEADDGRRRVLTSHASTPPMPATSWTGSSRSVDELVGAVPAELVGAGDQDVTADPHHRCRADGRQHGQQLRHADDQPSPDPLRRRRPDCAIRRPTSSIFTIRATSPYTTAVIKTATTTRMIARETSPGRSPP